MKITFLPQNFIYEAEAGSMLMEAAVKAGIAMGGTCGGKGTCGKCRVKTSQGTVLACRHQVTEDITVETEDYVAFSGDEKGIVFLPREFVFDRREPGTYGIAVDLGTTSMAVLLWDLSTGKQLDALSMENPQCAYGADVMSRISYAMASKENLSVLRQSVTGAIDQSIQRLAEKHHVPMEQILRVVVVGNTAMSQIFAGETVENLAAAPFQAKLTGGLTMTCQEAGLCSLREGQVYVAPNIGGHVGSDIAAGVTAAAYLETFGKEDRNSLYIDIGTNGEMVLSAKGNLYCCSAAAGPALEGQSISQGMRGVPGAIDHVKITDREKIELSVIGNMRPKGICGSGVIAAVAALAGCGIIDKTGRILGSEEVNDFVLSTDENGNPEVILTQKDVREVQLAKGAIFAAIEMLLEAAELTTEDLDAVVIAGSFGSAIDPHCAMDMGLLPRVKEDKLTFMGNAAAMGASMMLLSHDFCTETGRIAENTTRIELAASADFQMRYINAMGF